MKVKNVFSINQLGRRMNMEDCIYPPNGEANSQSRLFLVCDGVGGLSKGEEASRIACDSISRYLEGLGRSDFDTPEIENAVSKAIQDMNLYVSENPEADNMSTTMTLASVQDKRVVIAWCGDSRIYHIRRGKILWHSRDHSLVQQLLDSGEISPVEAVNHPQKNIILRSLNAKNEQSKIDTHIINQVQTGDYFLLCTDGILENINEHILYDILGPEQANPDKKALFLTYSEGRTHDNFSMYLFDVEGSGFSVQKNSKGLVFLLISLVFILIMAGTYFLIKNNGLEKRTGKSLRQNTEIDSSIKK